MLTVSGRAGDAVRPATAADLPALAGLCAAHAEFERAEPIPDDLAVRLEPALFSVPPRLWCLVAERDGELIGYASCSLEFSTWHAAEYLHMDCLFVSEQHRGEGWGSRLLDAVARTAASLGAAEVQWQTPDWNADAIRFYDRAGARALAKLRYSLPVPGGEAPVA